MPPARSSGPSRWRHARSSPRRRPDAKHHLFAIYAGGLEVGEEAEHYRDTIARALREGWAPASELERVSVRLIRRNPAVAAALAALASMPRPPDLAHFAVLAGDGLLRSLMAGARICDPDLEHLLTTMRSALLAASTPVAAEIAAPMLAFACDLARQCFINEYVFAESAAEEEMVRRLAAWVEAGLAAGDAIAAATIVALACHRPLHAVPAAARLLERTWPAAVDALLTQQVREPAAEQAIRATVPALTEIDDTVSRQRTRPVRGKPLSAMDRAAARAVRAFPLAEHLQMKFPLAPLRSIDSTGGTDVLIAGCGTGAHAIEICRRIRGARVLAIDLSRTSLAFATRKTRVLGLAIDYAQADILRLGEVDRAFLDLIEASGVLHHLADPFAGWRILLARLKPGGVMAIGLYSRLARGEINAIRAFIAAEGYEKGRPLPISSAAGRTSSRSRRRRPGGPSSTRATSTR